MNCGGPAGRGRYLCEAGRRPAGHQTTLGDLLEQALQIFAGTGADLAVERCGGPVEGLHGVPGSARPVERQHQVGPQPLLQWMLRYCGLDLWHQIAAAAELQ